NRFIQSNGESMNYGYTFWILDEWENVPNDTFMTQGHNLNDSYIVPSMDLVVVRQGNENGTEEDRLRFRKSLIQKIVAAIPRKP
ncbi:MAG: hypothetical protein JSV76_05820, partial [Candidatus Bathyarchaeota archaeon]